MSSNAMMLQLGFKSVLSIAYHYIPGNHLAFVKVVSSDPSMPSWCPQSAVSVPFTEAGDVQESHENALACMSIAVPIRYWHIYNDIVVYFRSWSIQCSNASIFGFSAGERISSRWDW